MIVSAPDTPNVCPTCDDTGLVAPLGGRGSDGPDPCPHCPPAAGSSSPDTAALNDWNTPMTPHPDTEPMLPRDPAATVDKAYDERDVWVETALEADDGA